MKLGWLLLATAIYASILLAITFLNRIGADRFWLGALNLYLPQFMWAVPGLLLTPLIFRVNRPWAWLPLLCVLWVLGPIMDGKVSFARLRPDPRAVRLRVMTWNIKYGSYQIAPLLEEISRNAPDLVLFQDASYSMDGPLRDYFRNWQVRSFGQFVIASRYPLSQAQLHELPSFGGDKERYLRCEMTLGHTVVSLYNLHLKTPRRSLNGFRAARRVPWYLPEAIERLEHNVRTRLLQALAVAGRLGQENGPVLVAGDFNAPDSSLVCATLRSQGLHDAFSEAGNGYGYSYGQLLFKHRLPWLQFSWMRIDHLMLGPMFVAERCWIGTGEASDHRPVVADLRLRYR